MIVQIDKASVTTYVFLVHFFNGSIILQQRKRKKREIILLISATRKEEEVLDYSMRDFIVPPISASFMIGLSMRYRLTWYQRRCIEFNSPSRIFFHRA
jgi:hypothetical protein